MQHGDGVGECVHWLAYFALIAKVVQPSPVFEIGTFRASSALNFVHQQPDRTR